VLLLYALCINIATFLLMYVACIYLCLTDSLRISHPEFCHIYDLRSLLLFCVCVLSLCKCWIFSFSDHMRRFVNYRRFSAVFFRTCFLEIEMSRKLKKKRVCYYILVVCKASLNICIEEKSEETIQILAFG